MHRWPAATLALALVVGGCGDDGDAGVGAEPTTMEELGRAVARHLASTEPPARIVVVDGPATGDLGEITVDVIGLDDDAVGGERLKIFAQPEPGGTGFTVRTVEATALCSRGVTGDRLCV